MLDFPGRDGKSGLNAWQRRHVDKQVAVPASLQVGSQGVGRVLAIRGVVWRRLRGAKCGRKSRPIAARSERLRHGRRECCHQDCKQSQKAADLQMETREHWSGGWSDAVVVRDYGMTRTTRAGGPREMSPNPSNLSATRSPHHSVESQRGWLLPNGDRPFHGDARTSPDGRHRKLAF